MIGTECVSNNTPNCMVGTNIECTTCERGYYLNVDKKCEQITVAKCDEFTPYRMANGTLDLPTSLYLNPKGYGCHTCQSGYTGVTDTPNDICVDSSYLRSFQFFQGSSFIDKCTNYQTLANKSIICRKCMANYIMSSSKTKCFSQSTLPNCMIAKDNGTECMECQSNYVSVNYQCQKKSIQNCLVYEDSSQLSNQVCKTCNPGYYLSTNQCMMGSVSNCKAYTLNSSTDCLECMDSFILI